MSAITFESRTRSVRVSGAERAHASIYIAELTTRLLDPDTNKDLILKALPATHYLNDRSLLGSFWSKHLYSAIGAGELKFEVDGNQYNAFELSLNTASSVGDDAVKMLARIHAQCEIHGFVAGENRAWMADIIENAPAEVFRPGYGWDEVVKLLHESTEGPVVMSYSITDNFLSTVGSEWIDENIERLNIELEKDEDEEYDEDYAEELRWERAFEKWGELSRDEQWDYASKWFEANSGRGLEITPSAWPIAFGYHEMTAPKILEELRK